jgi:threonine/homoserine/homoserine lactone efflux protein
MPSVPTLAAFAAAAVVLLVIPGPSVLYIVARSASQGRRAGLVSVAGIHVGTVVHVAAAVAGLSALVVASAAAFTAVKLAGAAYLIVLGLRTLWRSWRARGPAPSSVALRPRSMRRVFTDGVVVNVLNPKTGVFFLAFVPQFVDPARGHVVAQLAVLGAVFLALGVVSDGAYALGGAWIGGRVRERGLAARRTEVVAGTAYLGLGLATALAGGPRRP